MQNSISKISLCFLVWIFSLSTHAASLNSQAWGKPANTINIDLQSIPEPTLSESKKAFVTDNKFGFDVVQAELNWVSESFLNAIKPDMVVMDVGAGYGALTRHALNKGAIVINNEISENQQLYTLKHITPEQKAKLYLNQQDIRKVSLPNNSIDLLILHRVLHFFKGKDIENILTKTYEWLKPGGKIYVVMMSKDHIAFRDKIKYDTSKKWPGEDLVIIKDHLPEQAYALPPTLHVVSIETLEQALKTAGFKVTKTDFVSMKKFGSESNRDGKEAVGLVAEK